MAIADALSGLASVSLKDVLGPGSTDATRVLLSPAGPALGDALKAGALVEKKQERTPLPFGQSAPQIESMPAERAEIYAPDPYLESLTRGETSVVSSREKKQPMRLADAALGRGVRQENVIDANGAQIAAIQQITAQVKQARQRLLALRAKNRKA